MSEVVTNSYRFAGGCSPSVEIGTTTGSSYARACKTNYFTRYGSTISGTLTANLSFNATATKWASVAGGASGSITYQAMYDSDSNLVGSGQQDPYNLDTDEHYSVTDEFCTADATIRNGIVNTSTSCSDAGDQVTSGSGSNPTPQGITGFKDADNHADPNQLLSSATYGTGDNAQGSCCKFKHTDA